MDRLDERIVEQLCRDARMSFATLGAQIGLSASAVKRRVDRLVESGVIAGFTAVIDPAVMGWGTEAYVHVHCQGTISPQRLQEAFERVPQVRAAATVSGTSDAVLHLVARDVRDLERALERVREETAGIDRTETAIVLSRLIDRPPPIAL